MRINFDCPNCKEPLEVDSSQTGDTIRCEHCQEELFVPTVRLNRSEDELPTKRLEPGESIGGFRIERQISAGGMGVVYLAHQLSLQRDVALKVLSPLMAREASNIERFQSEVRLQARLDHPNIVPAFEAGYEGGLYYLAMSFVEGDSLDRIVRESGALACDRVMKIALDVADALGYAWADHHILHRDIKPSNIMIDSKGAIRLLDLGISKCLTDNEALTASGVICGTPQYMSPEQARGSRDLDCRSDMYSLGATLYFLVTGKHPFDGDNQLELIHRTINEPPTPVEQLRPDVTLDCSRLISRLMAKDPEDRPGTWQEVADEARKATGQLARTPRVVVPQPVPESAPVEAKTSAGAAAAKGLLAGCGVSVAFLFAVFLLFCYFVYSIFTAPGCGCRMAPPKPDYAQVSDLETLKDIPFAISNNSIGLGPVEKDWFWAARGKERSILIKGQVRLAAGESGGLGFVPVSPATNKEGEQIIPDAMFVRLATVDGQSVVRVEQKHRTVDNLHEIKLSQPVTDWIKIKLIKKGNSLSVTIGNQKPIVVQMYNPKYLPAEDDDDTYPSYWGIFADRGAKVELRLEKPKPKSDDGESSYKITISPTKSGTKTDSEPVGGK